MELNEIKSMWRAYDAKLEKTLRLNQHFLEMIQAQKVKSRLTPLFWQKSNGNWWTAQFVSSVVLIPLCVWVYQQVSHKNINKKWVKDFIQKSSGNRVTKSLEFVSELQSLKRDSI